MFKHFFKITYAFILSFLLNAFVCFLPLLFFFPFNDNGVLDTFLIVYPWSFLIFNIITILVSNDNKTFPILCLYFAPLITTSVVVFVILNKPLHTNLLWVVVLSYFIPFYSQHLIKFLKNFKIKEKNRKEKLLQFKEILDELNENDD